MKKTIALLNITLQITLLGIFTTIWTSILGHTDISGAPILGLIGGVITSVILNALIDEKVK